MISRINETLKNWVQSPVWLWAFIISVVLCLMVFAVNMMVADVSPASDWGIAYGIAATSVMVAVGLYGVRRRMVRFTRQFGAGKSHTWVQFHLYAGTLFLLLMFMHSGFRLPTGALTWALWIFSIWITVSGLIGALLQKWIPKLLTSGLSIEVHYDRIPELISEIRERVESMLKNCDDMIRDFYYKNLAVAFAGPAPRLIYYIDITGGIRAQTKQFDYLRRFLPATEKEKLDELEDMYRTKLEMDAHYTLQKALRWWLYLHVPVSLILLVLVGIHIYTILYY